MDSTTGGCACEHEAASVVSEETVCTLYQALQQVPDGRGKRGRRYPAALVLTLGPSSFSGVVVVVMPCSFHFTTL